MIAIARTPGRGHLAPGQLVIVDTGRNGPQALRTDAGAVWALWLSQGMPAGCLTSGYRPWDEQDDLRADYEAGRGGMADTPERSWHPDGVAADVAEPAQSWLRRHGGPAAVLDTVEGEPWHVLINSAARSGGTTHTLPLEDDVHHYIERLYRELNGRDGGLSEVASWADAARTQGMSTAALLAAFRANPAERGTVRAAYLSRLNREPSATDYAERVGRQTIGQVWDALTAAAAAGAK